MTIECRESIVSDLRFLGTNDLLYESIHPTTEQLRDLRDGLRMITALISCGRM